uniref:Transmembrane protein n=1 Tax=Plectus sambesii TaxID=2011161 RepID=A0A914X008_9BILA
MIRLGFPSGQQDAILVLSSLLSLQYICTTGYQTALNNWQCIGSTFGKTIYCTIDPNSNTCTQAVTELTCIAKYYDQQCNNDVGNMFCRASGNGAKIISEGICDSNAIDNACNKADSLNNNFLSIALALIIALAVTSLKHA